MPTRGRTTPALTVKCMKTALFKSIKKQSKCCGILTSTAHSVCFVVVFFTTTVHYKLTSLTVGSNIVATTLTRVPVGAIHTHAAVLTRRRRAFVDVCKEKVKPLTNCCQMIEFKAHLSIFWQIIRYYGNMRSSSISISDIGQTFCSMSTCCRL